MRVIVLANPRSGRGRALRLAGALERELRTRGHHAERLELDRIESLPELGGGADRIVVVGGDGTVHHACAAIARSRVPMYHLATGTENLFARSFRMSRDPSAVADHLVRDDQPRWIDLGSANGVPFVLMCSLGTDASVIHRVEQARSRTGGGHGAYIRPTIVEAFAPSLACVDVEADGRMIATEFTGCVVVSNLPAYALRIDPCHDARADDAKLDLALLPASTSVGAAIALGLCKVRSKRIVRVRAERFRLTGVSEGSCVQIDGERPGHADLPPILTRGAAIELAPCRERMAVHPGG